MEGEGVIPNNGLRCLCLGYLSMSRGVIHLFVFVLVIPPANAERPLYLFCRVFILFAL